MIHARRTIAGIELGRILGAGASAVVYAGRVRATRQRVAVKVVRPRPDHPADQIERALQEARVGWTVRHPNVVRVFEWGTTPEGEVYLVLERLEGRTLGALLAEVGTLSVPRALAIARQMAAGLAALHGHGVLHRDVKPDNVFLLDGDAEQVKLLDMGLVQLRLDHPHRMAWTAAGLSLGTPGYLAPEQARGDVATAATDVHGLGATLYHAVVGRAPYPTEATYDGLRAVALATAPPALPAQLPADVAGLLRGMLQPDAAARPADAEAVLDGLMGLQPPPPPAPDAPPPPSFPARAERTAHAGLRARIGAAVSAALAAGGGSPALRQRLDAVDALQARRRLMAARSAKLGTEAAALAETLEDREANVRATLDAREAERRTVRGQYLGATARLMELADQIEDVDRRYLELALALERGPRPPADLARDAASLGAARRTLEAAQDAVRRDLRDHHQAARALTRQVLEAQRALHEVALERATRLAELEHLLRAGEDQLAALDRDLEHAYLAIGVTLRLDGVPIPARPSPEETERTRTWRRPTPAERREAERRACALPVRVQGPGVDAQLMARDIGPGGVFLYADALPEADVLTLVLRGPGRPVRLQGRVVHRLPGVGFGVAFVGAPTALLEALGLEDVEATRTVQ